MQEILDLIPHRYPFLLVDRILEVVPGKFAKGIKNVSYNEPYFQGHFPNNKIMPGVLIIESLAQMCAIMYATDIDKQSDNINVADKIGYLAMVKNMKFFQNVVPGDQLLLEVKLDTQIGNLFNIKAKAFVDNKKIATGILVVSKKD
ncbi:3-hydroxyacyl-ACP dehydratase FabZ [Hathewaya histolytica]|uniref:3-hydroxyacyl-ACP dehydratase FabZ n=1 Tax=Hathewaya histolytica TaxID=1498 RepID=UPI003B674090